jgi:phytoene synthase
MIDPRDLEECSAAIRQGSHSFHAASLLLPGRVRAPSLALYAFCRQADDAVDGKGARRGAVDSLRRRLDRIYAGRPCNAAADRAFAQVVAASSLPRALPEALLDGFAWDAEGRRCETIADLRAYGARVAGSVGAMMTVLMGVRDADALARACDLGVAMQLTNVARDVGEDARAGRLYLPLEDLRRVGVDPDGFLADPQPSPGLSGVVWAVLSEADRLYARASAGIAVLPAGCRPGILAARYNYAAIGARVRAMGDGALTSRARTGRAAKVALVGLAAVEALRQSVMPCSAVLHAPPLPETAFLVAAASEPRRRTAWGDGRSGTVMSIMAELAARDRIRRKMAAEPATN